ncbi:MAG: LptE family protein [Planctomycetota bacterium]
MVSRIASVLLVGFSLATTMSSCGYRLGYRVPADVRSIAVPILENSTFPLRRDIEYGLTDALRREIQTRTPLKLVDRSVADMVVHGRILRFIEQVIAEGTQDEVLESTITVTVRLTIEDRVNETTITKTVTDSEPFSISTGETIDLARTRAIGNLAEKILFAIEAW